MSSATVSPFWTGAFAASGHNLDDASKTSPLTTVARTPSHHFLFEVAISSPGRGTLAGDPPYGSAMMPEPSDTVRRRPETSWLRSAQGGPCLSVRVASRVSAPRARYPAWSWPRLATQLGAYAREVPGKSNDSEGWVGESRIEPATPCSRIWRSGFAHLTRPQIRRKCSYSDRASNRARMTHPPCEPEPNSEALERLAAGMGGPSRLRSKSRSARTPASRRARTGGTSRPCRS